MRPPCSEKDYFQIHAACDSEGRVSSLRRALFSFTAPPPSPLWGFFCRRRCCIDGWSLKSAWRTPQALWRCLRWGRESRALPATPATTTATTPPVYRVHLEPTQMAPTVTLDCSLGNTKPFLSVLVHGHVLDNRICSSTCKHGGGNIILVLKYGFLCLHPRMHCVSCGYRASAGL